MSLIFFKSVNGGEQVKSLHIIAKSLSGFSLISDLFLNKLYWSSVSESLFPYRIEKIPFGIYILFISSIIFDLSSFEKMVISVGFLTYRYVDDNNQPKPNGLSSADEIDPFIIFSAISK